jgi:hypothetical protein
MTTIRHDLEARCPPERIWVLLSDLEAVARYNPGVRSASLQGSQRVGVGATRACELAPRGRVVERVTHWEEGRMLGLEVAESDWPIPYMRWVTRLEPRGAATRVTQDLEYRVKFRPAGWLLDRLVMRRHLTRTIDRVLASLIEHAERAP